MTGLAEARKRQRSGHLKLVEARDYDDNNNNDDQNNLDECNDSRNDDNNDRL